MEANYGAAPHWWVENINPKGINLGVYTGFNKIFTNNFLLGIEANIEDINASNKKMVIGLEMLMMDIQLKFLMIMPPL